MIHEPESGGASWQPHNAARLFERVAAALSAALPISGWPPPIFGPHEPDAVERSDPSWEFISSRPPGVDARRGKEVHAMLTNYIKKTKPKKSKKG